MAEAKPTLAAAFIADLLYFVYFSPVGNVISVQHSISAVKYPIKDSDWIDSITRFSKENWKLT